MSKSARYISSITNRTSVFGIMGGLVNRRLSGNSSMNRATSRLVIPPSAAKGLQYMRMHNLLSRNPQGSGGIGTMNKVKPCNCTSHNVRDSSPKKQVESLDGLLTDEISDGLLTDENSDGLLATDQIKSNTYDCANYKSTNGAAFGDDSEAWFCCGNGTKPNSEMGCCTTDSNTCQSPYCVIPDSSSGKKLQCDVSLCQCENPPCPGPKKMYSCSKTTGKCSIDAKGTQTEDDCSKTCTVTPPSPLLACTDGNGTICNPPIKQNDDSSSNAAYRGKYTSGEWPTSWRQWNGKDRNGKDGYCIEQSQPGQPYNSTDFFGADPYNFCYQGLRQEGSGYNVSNVMEGGVWGGACKTTENRCTVNGVDNGDKFLCKNWITSFGKTGFVKITNPKDILNAQFENNESPYIPIAFGHGINADERCGGCHLIRLQGPNYNYYLAVMTLDVATSSLEIGEADLGNLTPFVDWKCKVTEACPGESHPISKPLDFIMLDECPQAVEDGSLWPGAPRKT